MPCFQLLPMRKDFPVKASDLRAYNRLAMDAALAATDLLENLHHNVARLPGALAEPSNEPAPGIAGFVYRVIRGATRKIGDGMDHALQLLNAKGSTGQVYRQREILVAALNGLVGDHLHESGNSLSIPMRLRRDGVPLQLESESLRQCIPCVSGKLAVFVHGLCMSDLQWRRRDHDHGEALANALGYSTLYLHYNSGLHISSNGRELAEQLEALVDAWPVPLERLTIIGYSMGGLLARSACAHARETGQRWLGSLRDLIFIGTPHDGSPLERAGNRIDRVLGRSPYTVALSRLGKMRSAGITDLRHANLCDSDWQGQDRFHSRRGVRKAMPLPESVHCRAIAGTLSKHLRLSATRLAGDGLVPVSSALGRHPDPQRNLGLAESDCMIAYARNHLDLLDSAEVFEQIRVWLDDASPGSDLRIPWSESFS